MSTCLMMERKDVSISTIPLGQLAAARDIGRVVYHLQFDSHPKQRTSSSFVPIFGDVLNHNACGVVVRTQIRVHNVLSMADIQSVLWVIATATRTGSPC